MSDVIRVGVIGTGVGCRHIEAFQALPDVEVAAVCSADQLRAAAIARQYRIPLATTEYRRLLAADLHAVVIATPPPLHLPMGLDALAAGRHVLCEKPLALTTADARTLRDAAHRAGVVHMINHYLRFTPPFVRARELVDAGYLGDLAVADAMFVVNPVDYLTEAEMSPRKAGWFTDAAQGGGMLQSAAGPHLVDAFLWYGGPIAEIAAQTGVSRPTIPLLDGSVQGGITAEDIFAVVGRFAGGGTLTIRGIPVAHHGGDARVALHGTAGSLEMGWTTLRGATGADRGLVDLPLPADVPSNRVAVATRFIAAVRAGGGMPVPDFDDGVAAQVVLDACAEAARTKRWVTLASEG